MTYIADLDPNSPKIAADEARADFFDAEYGDWETRAGYGDRFLSGDHFPVEPANIVDSPTVADWEAFAEANWSDPAERDF